MRRLMTIPGIHVTTATTLVSVIGDVRRFLTLGVLLATSGCTRAFASRAAGRSYGRISKERSAAARQLLVEAAWIAAR
jgi:transposase